MIQTGIKTLRDSAGMRWTALLLLALAMFCSYVFMDILSPIKDLMESTRGWDSASFGRMQGAEVFLNVYVFFLIFAGIILDKMGVRFTAVLSGAVMLFGGLIKFYAVSDYFIGTSLDQWFTDNLNWKVNIPFIKDILPFADGMPGSAKLAAIGFMFFGCGCEMAGITVSRGIVKWFKGRETALAMGSEMALARLGVATCMIFSPYFAKLGGEIHVDNAVKFGVVLLCIALIMFITYFFMDKKLDSQTGEAEEKDDPFKVGDLGKIFSSLGFWLVALLCVLYYSAIFPFQKYAVNMLQCNLTLTAPDADSFWASSSVTIVQYVIMRTYIPVSADMYERLHKSVGALRLVGYAPTGIGGRTVSLVADAIIHIGIIAIACAESEHPWQQGAYIQRALHIRIPLLVQRVGSVNLNDRRLRTEEPKVRLCSTAEQPTRFGRIIDDRHSHHRPVERG